jgi:hypothetical protein
MAARNSFWCPGEDSNLHELLHWYLKPARLPVPPPGLKGRFREAQQSTHWVGACQMLRELARWPVTRVHLHAVQRFDYRFVLTYTDYLRFSEATGSKSLIYIKSGLGHDRKLASWRDPQ